jgi:muramidase (phage lysozyme)
MIGNLSNIEWFTGVVAVGDTTNSGRIKVRCFGYHPEVSGANKEDLPWAICLRPYSRFQDVPAVGDLVMGFFMDGRDAQQPVVIGIIPSAHFSVPYVSYNSPGAITSGTPTNLSSPSINTTLDPIQRAFLDALSSHESGGAYDILNGGQSFNPNNGHPDVVGSGGTSTAAGRYQFIYSTWIEENGGVNLPMTPARQDLVAWKYASSVYRARTGHDLYNELQTSGLTPSIMQALSPTWTSFGNGNWTSSIETTYSASLGKYSGTSNTELASVQGTNPYLDPSARAISNYGNPPVHSNLSGEGIDKSPVFTQTVAMKTANVQGYSVSEPAKYYSGSSDSGSIWATRPNGSYIEVSGTNDDDEFISVGHVTGSHILIDPNGNVTIRSMGRIHQSTTGDSEELVDGVKICNYDGGYVVSVTGGKTSIHSDGPIELVSGGDISLNAGGNFSVAAGGSIDMSAGKVSITSRVDSMDLLAATEVAIESKSGPLSLTGQTGIALNSLAGTDIISTNDIKITSHGTTQLLSSGSLYLDAGGTIRFGEGLAQSGTAGVAASPASTADPVPQQSTSDIIQHSTPSSTTPTQPMDI